MQYDPFTNFSQFVDIMYALIFDPNVLLSLEMVFSNHNNPKCIKCGVGTETHWSADAWLTFTTVVNKKAI